MQGADTQKEAAKESIRSFYVFVRNFWYVNNTDPYQDNWHIKYLCDVLQEYALAIIHKKPIEDLIINIPPGMSKSTIVSHAFVPWVWLHAPGTVVLSSCVSSTLAEEHSTKCKNIIKSERYQLWFQEYYKKKHGTHLEFIKDTIIDWTNNFNGRRYATYTGGPVIGTHFHVFTFDDPMSVEMTYYKKKIEKAHRFNDKSVSTRKKNKDSTPSIYVMQRLHNDDTTGHELKKVKEGKKIRHICMPARLSKDVKPPELAKYYKDGLLDPVRCSEEVLALQKIDLGSAAFTGQFMQAPTSEESSIIKSSFFVHEEETMVPFNIVWDMWIDGAYTDNPDNDPTGILIAGYHKETARLYKRLFISKHLELPELLKLIPELFYLNGYSNRSRIYIEPKASGKSMRQMINTTTKMPALDIKTPLVNEGKRARIMVASPKYESGRVVHVIGNWNEEYETQLTQFGAHEHDEAVDLAGYTTDHYFGARFSNMEGGS